MRIAIDLTPILPGGSNGGAKIMTIQLIKELAKLAPKDIFIILASKKNFAELSVIKAPNIEIICELSRPRLTLRNLFLLMIGALLWPILKLTKKILPANLKARLGHHYHQFRSNLLASDFANLIKPDLLFCPFTAPFYHHLNVPIVSIIYDLQSHHHPHFFNTEERYERKKNFEEACKRASKLICISNFVKQTVLAHSQFSEKNIKAIHIRLAHRLPQVEENKVTTTLNRYQLTKNNYLLFPANYWLHKNHQMLFTAFNLYRAKYPDSTLKLVCTGADNDYKQFLLGAINEMDLSSWIKMPGFLTDEEFATLMTSCRAVIFPSLYEGFGMPVLEAMVAGKPVLCSNMTSLPEVAGSAALLFDPRKPDEIAAAIHQIEFQTDMLETLVKLGHEHIAKFGTETDMAREYLQVFHEAVQTIPG